VFRALTLAVLLTAATSTQAAIITSGYINSLEEVDINPNGPKTAQFMTLNLFDTTLGTLDYASITYQLHVQRSGIFDNDSPESSTFDNVYGVAAEFEIFGAPIVFGIFIQNDVTLDGDDGDGAGAQNGGADELVFGPEASYHSVTEGGIENYPSPGYGGLKEPLSKAGGGTFETRCQLGMRGGYNNTGTPVDDLEISTVTWGACGATVEYHFTEAQVPEPAALLLLGTGLLGMIGVRWRRKAAS